MLRTALLLAGLQAAVRGDGAHHHVARATTSHAGVNGAVAKLDKQIAYLASTITGVRESSNDVVCHWSDLAARPRGGLLCHSGPGRLDQQGRLNWEWLCF